MSPLIDGFLGLTQPSQHKDALHNKIPLLGMGKNVMGSQNENGNKGKQPSNIKLDFRDVYGFMWGKTSSLNPKIVVLFFPFTEQ